MHYIRHVKVMRYETKNNLYDAAGILTAAILNSVLILTARHIGAMSVVRDYQAV